MFGQEAASDTDDYDDDDSEVVPSMTSAGYWSIQDKSQPSKATTSNTTTGINKNGHGVGPQGSVIEDLSSSFEEHFKSKERLSAYQAQGGALTRPRITFSEWLRDRREILNIARKSNQSLD